MRTQLPKIAMIASVLVLLFANASTAVEWAKTYGNYYTATSFEETEDEGYIVVGYVSSNTSGGDDAWVMKVNFDGTVGWANSYGDSADNRANSVQQTPDGGFIVLGYTDYFYFGGKDVWIFKLNPDGSIAWQKVYGGPGEDAGTSIQLTSDGGYIVTGYNGGSSLWVLKLDANGNSIWQKIYTSTGWDEGISIEQTSDGGYILTGLTTFFSNTRNYWVIKLDGFGNIAWQHAYGGPAKSGDQGEIPTCIQQTTDGGYITVGSSGRTPCLQTGVCSDPQAYILKLDPNGVTQWQKAYSGSGTTSASSVVQTPDGGFLVAGYYLKAGANTADAWLLKLNSNGGIVWQKIYDNIVGLKKIIKSKSGSGYIAISQDASILKVDDNGNINNCTLIAASDVTASDTNVVGQGINVFVTNNNVTPKIGDATSSNRSVAIKTLCSSITDEVISIPSLPTGPDQGAILKTYTYSTGGSLSNKGHALEYQFDWGDGSYSDWSSSAQMSKSWSSPNNYLVRARARCAQDTYVLSDWSSALSVKINPVEAITTPTTLSGPINGNPGVSYLYVAGGSTSNLGHTIQYLFDWGDGTNSGWLSVGQTSASKLWLSTGSYLVKAKARCSADTGFESNWSGTLSVTISQPAPDLTGLWTIRPTQTCKTSSRGVKCSLKGTFTVSNLGTLGSPSASVNFYLSDSPTYNEGNAQIKVASTGKLKVGKNRALQLNCTFPIGQTATGKYTIAIIDKDNLVPETNKNNNQVSYGPLP